MTSGKGSDDKLHVLLRYIRESESRRTLVAKGLLNNGRSDEPRLTNRSLT
jgi:hypothetical protein